jgi:hypothetical protein
MLERRIDDLLGKGVSKIFASIDFVKSRQVT